MTTTTDIANRALQLVGTRTTVASLAEASNEAIQINLVYTTVVDWCHALCNWNFARKTAALVLGQSLTPPPGTWASTKPSPPWLFEYKLPSDFIRALYLTNNTANAGNTAFLGLPARFVLATDILTAVQQEVLLTNETSANLVYVSRVSDPTLWPSFFERFVVSRVAQTVCFALTGDKELTAWLTKASLDFYTIADSINRAEGLDFSDNTPEWEQAIGIPYPFRRADPSFHDVMRLQDGNKQR